MCASNMARDFLKKCQPLSGHHANIVFSLTYFRFSTAHSLRKFSFYYNARNCNSANNASTPKCIVVGRISYADSVVSLLDETRFSSWQHSNELASNFMIICQYTRVMCDVFYI